MTFIFKTFDIKHVFYYAGLNSATEMHLELIFNSLYYMHGLIFIVSTWGVHLLSLVLVWTPAAWAIFLVDGHKNGFYQISLLEGLS